MSAVVYTGLATRSASSCSRAVRCRASASSRSSFFSARKFMSTRRKQAPVCTGPCHLRVPVRPTAGADAHLQQLAPDPPRAVPEPTERLHLCYGVSLLRRLGQRDAVVIERT